MELAVIDDIHGTVAARVPFVYSLPAENDLNKKLINLIEPPSRLGVRRELPAEPERQPEPALPEFVDFSNPDWHRGAEPYAHYVIEGSIDGLHWTTLVDRRHGPWRGPQAGNECTGLVNESDAS